MNDTILSSVSVSIARVFVCIWILPVTLTFHKRKMRFILQVFIAESFNASKD